MASSVRLLCRNGASLISRRALHSSSSAQAISKFMMPAMSPTMTEGGIASWKVKDGDKFSAGDVLLEIETDKATMDVEAQDDGIMAKIVIANGAKAVPVGKTIAMLAEEGDDISNVEMPAEESKEAPPPKQSGDESASSSSSSPPKESESNKSKTEVEARHAPQTSKPLMPSVMRLLADFNVSSKDAESIKGTGMRGMLTKGDVLVFLGKATGPTGTFKQDKRGISALGGSPAASSNKGNGQAKKSSEPLTADQVRSMILSGLASSSHASRSKEIAAAAAVITPLLSRKSAFDHLLDDYQFKTKTSKPVTTSKSEDSFQGLL